MSSSTASDSEWLYDFVMQIFRSPTWEVPLMEWIDENCVTFDNDEENKLAYTDSHKEFCQLVESLLELHLEEIGLTAEDFVHVCATAGHGSMLHTAVFEHVLAVDDFLTFKKLMCKRNAELELEALREIARKSAEINAEMTTTASLGARGRGQRRTRRKRRDAQHHEQAIGSGAGAGAAAAAATVEQTSGTTVPALIAAALQNNSTSSSSLPPPTTTTTTTSPQINNTTNDEEDEEDEEEANEEDSLRAAIEASLAIDRDVERQQMELEVAQMEAAIALSLALEEEKVRISKDIALEEAAAKKEPPVGTSISLSSPPAVAAAVANTVAGAVTGAVKAEKVHQEESVTQKPKKKQSQEQAIPLVSGSSNSSSTITTATPGSMTSLSGLPSLSSRRTLPSSANENTSSLASSTLLGTVLDMNSVLGPAEPKKHAYSSSSDTFSPMTTTSHNRQLPPVSGSMKFDALAYNAELDAALGGGGADGEDNDELDDLSRMPYGVRRAEEYLEQSKQKLGQLRQQAAKIEDGSDPAVVAARQAHLRSVRESLRAKTKVDRGQTLANAEAAGGATAIAIANTTSTSTSSGSGSGSTAVEKVKSQVANAIAVTRASILGENGAGDGDDDAELTEDEKRKIMRLALAAKIKSDVIQSYKN